MAVGNASSFVRRSETFITPSGRLCDHFLRVRTFDTVAVQQNVGTHAWLHHGGLFEAILAGGVHGLLSTSSGLSLSQPCPTTKNYRPECGAACNLTGKWCQTMLSLPAMGTDQ